MSLCIATSVPDGIVICADTLQTMKALRRHSMAVKCGSCATETPLNVDQEFDIGNFPTARKLHHLEVKGKDGLVWDLALINAGALLIGEERVSKLVRDFEKTIDSNDPLDKIANNLRLFLEKSIVDNCKLKDISVFNNSVNLVLAGYDKNSDGLPKKFVIKINRTPSVETYHGYSAAWVGRTEIPSLLNNQQNMREFGLDAISLMFHSMNLKDAIDYNCFLINTVMNYQKFAPMVPDVGGLIEVGILYKERSFRWVNKMEV